MKNTKYFFIGLVFATIFILAFPNIIAEYDNQWEYLEWDVPDGVEPGDIMFSHSPPQMRYLPPYRDDGHFALYLGNNTFIHAVGGPKATNDGIKNWSYKHFANANWIDSISFYRVTTEEPRDFYINKVINFTYARKNNNAGYQMWYNTPFWPYRKIADPDLTYEEGDIQDTSNKFWCGEFVWAAYYSIDIDIDSDGWSPASDENDYPAVRYASCFIPYDIVGDDETGNEINTEKINVNHRPHPPKTVFGPGSIGNIESLWGFKSAKQYAYYNFSFEAKAIPGWNYGYIFRLKDLDGDNVSLKVDWGDGNISDWSEYLPTGGFDLGYKTLYHTYWEPCHQYNVTATCKDTSGKTCLVNLTFTVNTTVWPPFLAIRTNSEDNTFNGSAEDEIQYIGNVSGGTAPYSWTWNFGDGTEPTNGQNVTHVFEETGIYLGKVSVQDANGTRNEINITTNVAGIRLKATPNPQLKGKQLTFTAEVVDVEHENNTFYVFNISGNNIETSSSSYQYTYEVSGIYESSVMVYDGQGGPFLGEDNVTVVIDPFLVDIGVPDSGIVNQTINFRGSVYGFKGDWVSAYWNFGDGSGAYGFNVSHKYTETFGGNYKDYTVTFTVFGPGQGGKEDANDSSTIRIWNESFSPPVANVTGPSCGSPGQTLVFDGTNSNGTNLTYMWKVSGGDWEEGNSTLNKAFYPDYHAIPSIYFVSLKVTDGQTNFSSVDTTSVFISELKADFNVPSNINDTSPVQFYDNSAPDGCSGVTSWKWFFGDGSPYSTSKNPVHQYDDDGYYSVKLIIGSGGNYDSVTKTVYVSNVPPEAQSSVELRVAAVGDNVTFNSTSYDVDGDIVDWEWQFGDERRGYGNNTTHAYDFSGLFTIGLGVTDDDYASYNTVKDDYLLIADTIISNDFDENSTGWNATRFNDIQEAIYATPWGGLLVILDGQYQISDNLTVGIPIDIYGIKKGYNQDDTEIEYGGVEIKGGSALTSFDVVSPYVNIKGITFNDSGTGVRIMNSFYYPVNCSYNFTNCTFSNCSFAANCTNSTNVTFYNCSFDNNDRGITCKNSSHINIRDTDMTSGGEVFGIKLINSDNVTIQDTEISYGNSGLIIENSKDNTIQSCSIQHVDDTAILIDNSSGNVISDCSIAYAYKGVEVVDVSLDTSDPLMPDKMLNTIKDTNFTYVDYGVYLYNSSHTKISKKFNSGFVEMAGVFPIYSLPESSAGLVATPFPSTLENATSIFASNEYPVYIDHSHHNLVEGIAVIPLYQSMNNTPPSSQDAISIHDSYKNVIASCFIQNANRSAINITSSDDNTICICMLKENQQGITISEGGSHNNLVIACSFFNNTDYGVEMKAETNENIVIYNDFVFNNGSGSESETYNQAYDAGDNNMWDDDGCSVWRDLVCGNYEIMDEKKIGNFWADYKNASFSENGTGPLPSNLGPTALLPTGEEPYFISGPSESEDCGPILLSLWPESWYVGDYPWVDPEQPYPLPPVLYLEL